MADPIQNLKSKIFQMARKIFRQSEFLNERVIDREMSAEVGRVEVLWMYPPVHRVLGFVCKAGWLGGQKTAFRLDQIEQITDAEIIVNSSGDATDSDRVRQLESLIGLEVWSDGDEKIGKIIDCLFDRKTGEITQYLFVGGFIARLIEGIYELSPAKIRSFNDGRVVVAEAEIDGFLEYQEGLQQKLEGIAEFFQYETDREVRSLKRKTRTWGDRLFNLKEQVQERTQEFSEEAKEKAQIIRQQLQEESQPWMEQVKERGQDLTAQVKEKTQTLSQRVESGIQTLTVQAEEILDAAQEESPLDRLRQRFNGAANSQDEAPEFEDGIPVSPLDDADEGELGGDRSDTSSSHNSLDDDLWDDEFWDGDDSQENYSVQASPVVTPHASTIPARTPQDEVSADLPLDIPKGTDTSEELGKKDDKVDVDDDDDEPWI